MHKRHYKNRHINRLSFFASVHRIKFKGWFPYDRGSQIAIRSAIVCDHMETTSAIVCDPAIMIADDRRR